MSVSSRASAAPRGVRPRRVVAAVDSAYSTHRHILSGIMRFARQRREWSVEVFLGRSNEPRPPALSPANYDGAIGNFHAPAYRDLFPGIAVPAVFIHPDLSRPTRPPLAPDVRYLHADNAAIATRAAEYFLDRGCRSFAYVGDAVTSGWSEERRIAFTSCVTRRGFLCAVFAAAARARAADVSANRLALWLKRLPPGTGLLAANDSRACHVLDLCRKLGIDVPGRLAVLGVDNDETLCEPAALSSVALTCEEAGFRAAEALDLMMDAKDGDAPSPSPVLMYSVASVITRASTGFSLTNDPLVRRALEIIRAAGGVGLTVEDLLQRLNVSRRSLEYHFRHEFATSPYEEIQLARLRRVNELARDPALTASEIALRCGFAGVSHLSAFYRRMTSRTLTDFRRKN